MPCLPVRFLGYSLIAAIGIGPAAGRPAAANDAEPTVFQRAIGSWMGVVALLAEDGDGASKETNRGDAQRPERERSARGDREGDRGDRRPGDWSRDRGPGPRGPGMRMHTPPPGTPPMHGMHGMHGMRPDAAAKLDEIAARLSRIERKLDSSRPMGNPWSPRPEAGARPGFGRGERPQAPMAAMPPEMQERVKGMMEEGRKRMAEAQEKMEQARRRFAEMEERIKKLEGEVERLKAGK